MSNNNENNDPDFEIVSLTNGSWIDDSSEPTMPLEFCTGCNPTPSPLNFGAGCVIGCVAGAANTIAG